MHNITVVIRYTRHSRSFIQQLIYNFAADSGKYSKEIDAAHKHGLLDEKYNKRGPYKEENSGSTTEIKYKACNHLARNRREQSTNRKLGEI